MRYSFFRAGAFELFEIAYEPGFKMTPHKDRIFKADMGVTPGHYRSIMSPQ